MTELLKMGNYSQKLQEENPLIYTPEAARIHLAANGYADEDLPRLLQGREQGSSHGIYALAVIASGNETRHFSDVYHELYLGQKHAANYDDAIAQQAADIAAANGGWERFVKNTR